MRASLLPLFLFLGFFHLTCAAVTITIGIETAPLPFLNLPSLKQNVSDEIRLMYIGNYATTDLRVQAMKFATQYINNMTDILPNTRIQLYGFNSRGNRAETTSAVFAGFKGYEISGFIGAESLSDTIALQYIAGAYWVPQINPSVVEQRLSSPTDFRSLFSIIPPSSDQQIVILGILKYLGISSALIISTNNEYGNEMNDMVYNAETLKLNITFHQIGLDTNGGDFDQKINIVKEQMHFYRYVIMHCTAATGQNFLKALGDAGYVGPQYVYIFTHQMVSAVRERTSSSTYLPYFNGAIGINARYESDQPFSQDIRTAWSRADTSVYPGAANGGDLMSAWFAFDAVYTYALALDRIQKQGKTIDTITPEDYYKELLKSEFIGATGNITVNVTASRRRGQWDIYNFVAENVNSTSNGTVKPQFRGIGNGASTEFQLLNGQFTFFGGNTTLPPPYKAPPEKIQIRKFNTALSAGLGAVLGLAVLVTIFATFMLLVYWRSFARHGSFYCSVIITGVYVGLMAALVLLPEPTDTLCIAFPWLLGIGFVLIYGCLFIKTWVLYLVWWNAEKFRKTTITPMTIVRAIGASLVLEAIFLIVWTVVDPPQAKLHRMVDGYYMLQCSTDNDVFWGVFTGIKGLWLIFGALLSIICRGVMREFNHSSSIAYSIYNIFVLLIIGVPLAITLEDVPGGRIIIQFAVIVIGFTFTVVSLFFGVWYRVFVPEDLSNITVSSHSAGGVRTVSRSYSGHSAHSKSSNSQEREEENQGRAERGISMSKI